MNNHFEPLDNGEVLSISESALIYIGHTTFRVGEFSEAVRSQLEHNTEGWNEGKNSWFTDMGVDCEVLRFTSGGWQKGKVRLRLEFSPDNGDDGSDRQQVSVQPSVSGITTTSEATSTLSEHPVAPTGFVDATSPMAAAVMGAAVVGTAVVGGIALGYDKDSSPEISEEGSEATSTADEDFDLAPPTPEFELASLDNEDFDLDPPQSDFTSSEESGLEDIDFAGDNLISQPEVNILENDDFNLESSSTDLLGLESEDFSLETSDTDLSGLEDVDFALENSLEDQETTSLEDAEFDLGTTEADLSGLAEDDFNLGSMEEEESNLETPDFSLETSFIEQELTSLDDEPDFGLESTAESELENLGSADLSSLGAEDFETNSDTDFSGFEDEAFASETTNSEDVMGGMGDFEFAASSDDEFTSMESGDFGLDSLDTDFSGLENADFGSDSPESMSFLESEEAGSLEDEFGLETPEPSSAGTAEPDFGLDELLGNDADGDDLEFLSISDQDKQEIEQAAAEVSQAFDDDFGLELDSRNGLDNLEFDFAGDDEMDAIDKQLADALGDDLDRLGTSEGLTENLFADQDDALFKDVWEDINKSQVK